MKTLFIFFFTLGISCPGLAQNINFEWVGVSLYRLPLKPLTVEEKTYSTSIQDLGNQLDPTLRKTLQEALEIPGFTRKEGNAAVQVELIVSPLAVTSKELKDSPFTVEKNGVKTVYHHYDYLLNCSFPAKFRVVLKGGQTIEQELPAFFQTKYYGRKATTEIELQTQWESDYSFQTSLLKERTEERAKELKTLLFNHYGYGMNSENISIGYVKDKKGEYPHLTRAMALLREAFLYASNKELFRDETFESKVNEAKGLLEKELSQGNEDKKARINPKVMAMIHYNLGLVSYALQDFDNAREHLGKTTASRSTEAEANTLLDKIRDQQTRLVANGLQANQDKILPGNSADAEPASPKMPAEIKDYIVGKKLDTLEVRFLFPPTAAMPFGDTLWMQDKVVIATNGTPSEFFPDDLHGFCYKGIYHESLWWLEDVTTNPWTIAKKFCKRIVHGAIPVYLCHQVITDEEGYKKVESRQYYKKDDKFVEVMFLNFNRGVSKLVSRDPALSEKVRNGEFKREDFLTIIQQYNNFQEPKTSH